MRIRILPYRDKETGELTPFYYYEVSEDRGDCSGCLTLRQIHRKLYEELGRRLREKGYLNIEVK